jgi:hypothetical protein
MSPSSLPKTEPRARFRQRRSSVIRPLASRGDISPTTGVVSAEECFAFSVMLGSKMNLL